VFLLPAFNNFLGFIAYKDGRCPDPQKVAAVANMPAPHNITTLRSFRGLVSYYQYFVPNMRSIRQPIDDLLKKDNEWNWSTRSQQAFDSIKGILNSDLLLTHYDPSLQTHKNMDCALPFNTGGQTGQSRPFIILRVH
jgi:hypothetical protein